MTFTSSAKHFNLFQNEPQLLTKCCSENMFAFLVAIFIPLGTVYLGLVVRRLLIVLIEDSDCGFSPIATAFGEIY